jgi:hypothetical protein
MRVLALDLATICGWAFGSPNGSRIEYGSFKLPSTDHDIGRFLIAFDDWLDKIIERFAPDEIIFESPVLPAKTTLPVLRKLYGLAGQTEIIARRNKIPCREASISAIRWKFIGVRFAPKSIRDKRIRRIWVKEATMRECRRRGFRVSDDNQADALALLNLRLAQRVKGFRLTQEEKVAA